MESLRNAAALTLRLLEGAPSNPPIGAATSTHNLILRERGVFVSV